MDGSPLKPKVLTHKRKHLVCPNPELDENCSGIKLTLSLTLMVLLFSWPTGVAASSRCEPFDGTAQALYKCDRQLVHFIAKVPTIIEQHPTGLLSKFDLNQKRPIPSYESYVNLGDPAVQIVLSYREPIRCKELIEITGEVRIINLSGPEGSKGAYHRPWIDVSRYECKHQQQAKKLEPTKY